MSSHRMLRYIRRCIQPFHQIHRSFSRVVTCVPFIPPTSIHLGLRSRSNCVGLAGHLLKPTAVWRDNSVNFHRESTKMTTLEEMKFDNLVLRRLPIDSEEANFVREVRGACFSKVQPTPVVNPTLVGYALPALKLLDLSEEEVKRPEFVEYFSGNKILPGSDPAAHCYCGHQFGNFAGQLGDGAAMYLGEVINHKGERWEIQIKGGGPTPYSRSADGRKVLRSSIREFLCSEAMHHLGIPTTRAGCCVTSDTKVIRDINYNGNPIAEKCSIVLRMAPSFIRFGSFQITKPVDRMTGREGPSVCLPEVVQTLTDYVIETFYPEIDSKFASDRDGKVKAFFQEVVRRTACLVAEWQCVGWCHGVLNTDNMSILGLTIDYGPYGFMDRFDPHFICNASDDGGRYTYTKQPEMCQWNCLKLAEALQEQVPLDQLTPILDSFQEVFQAHYLNKMRHKFGFLKKEIESDKDLTQAFLDTMEKTGADFTNSFRLLSKMSLPGSADYAESKSTVLEGLISQSCTMEELLAANRPRMDPRQLQMFVQLLETNPNIVAQLGRGASVILKELDRIEKFKVLKEKSPETKTSEDRQAWTAWLDQYAQRLHQEVDSSDDLNLANKNRLEVMNAANPRFILRNYIAQRAIEEAENGDYTELNRVLAILQQPYSDDSQLVLPADCLPRPSGADVAALSENTASLSLDAALLRTVKGESYDGKPPKWAADLRVT